MSSISVYILAILLGWLVAQGLKYVIAALKTGSLSKTLSQLYLSGNMPSAHSATAVSLLVVVGYRDGLDSAIFALALLFASIIMYDAMMVRRSSGEQGEAIRLLIKSGDFKIKKPRVAKGHSPIEVFVGAIIGIVVGATIILLAT